MKFSILDFILYLIPTDSAQKSVASEFDDGFIRMLNDLDSSSGASGLFNWGVTGELLEELGAKLLELTRKDGKESTLCLHLSIGLFIFFSWVLLHVLLMLVAKFLILFNVLTTTIEAYIRLKYFLDW